MVSIDNNIYNATPRGNLKLNKLYVGDIVEVTSQEYSTDYTIDSVYPRKNTLLRPPLCNVDQIVVVIAPIPKPDFLLIDKLIINARMLDIDVILVVNKCDISSIYQDVYNEYRFVASHIIETSAQNSVGVDELVSLLKGKFSCFVGQSAVGKSTLLNAINPTIKAETGGLSKKIERGKNTTRHSEIYMFENILLADTPGFSLYDLEINFDEIKDYYPELTMDNPCKYLNCNHVNETANECEVIKAVNSGRINQNRYNRYKELFLSTKEKWQNKYR